MYVVTLPTSATDPTAYAQQAKDAGADILEIRGDLTPDVEPFDSPLLLLISPRGKGEEFVEKFDCAYVDLETKEQLAIGTSTSLSASNWSAYADASADRQLAHTNFQTIHSFHDYEKTSSLQELQNICDDLLKNNPDILKIATYVNSYADVKTLNQLHDYLQSDQKRVILGMGPMAHTNRMLSPWKNELTYTHIDDADAAAPGQVPLSMYQLTKHCNSPTLYGILGSLDVQSKSPLIHNTLFEKYDVDALYTNCLTDDLDDAWEHLTQMGYEGFSVTSPWKQEIMHKLDRLDPEAEKLTTVNTVVRENDEWVGYPRDSHGLVHGYDCLEHAQSASILGSGGVVPSVIHACKETGIETIHLFARNEQKRKELAEKFDVHQHPLDECAEYPVDIIFNAIATDIAVELPDPPGEAHAIDLRYGRETQFLKDVQTMGYAIHDGLPMLIHQALAQFELFTGMQPSNEDIELLKNILKS